MEKVSHGNDGESLAEVPARHVVDGHAGGDHPGVSGSRGARLAGIWSSATSVAAHEAIVWARKTLEACYAEIGEECPVCHVTVTFKYKGTASENGEGIGSGEELHASAAGDAKA